MKKTQEKPKVKMFKLLWEVMTSKNKANFAWLMVLGLVSSLAILIPVQLISIIISSLTNQDILLFGIKLPNNIPLFALVLGAGLLTYLMSWIRMFYRNQIELLIKRVVSNLRNTSYSWLIEPRKNMDLKMTPGDAAYRVNEGPDAIVSTMQNLFGELLPKLMTAVVAFVFVIFLDILSLPIILIGLVLVAISSVVRAKIERKISESMEIARSSVTSSVVNSIANLAVINLFRTMTHERKIFADKIEEYYGTEKKFLKLRLIYWTIVNLFEVFCTFFIMYLCAVRVYEGTMIVGNIVVISNYVDRIFTPIQDLGWFSSRWVQCKVKFERLKELQADADHLLPIDTITIDDINSIKIDNVDIQNGDIFKIKGLNFEFKKGQLTVLYGESGCGKSTVIRFICGLCEKLEGNLLVNDIPIQYPYQLTEYMSVTMQSPYIFNRDVKYNIAYPSGTAADKQQKTDIVKNLKLEDIFERKFDDKKQQSLENMLSGGEKKRICITRGLLRPAKLYIFDEPTNDLDHDNAMKVLNYINELKKDAIVITISHDKRLMDMADQLLKVDHRVMIEAEEQKGLKHLPTTEQLEQNENK